MIKSLLNLKLGTEQHRNIIVVEKLYKLINFIE